MTERIATYHYTIVSIGPAMAPALQLHVCRRSCATASEEDSFMVMMTPATHQFVDQKLREAAEVIEKAQNATIAKKGYKNFELALGVIYECRTMIDQETENDAVMGHLKTAAVALAPFSAGDAAPSVQSAIRSIGDIVDKLPD
jgi:hypothetical protein